MLVKEGQSRKQGSKMAWHELYPINEQPSADQIAAYIDNPLWETFNDYLNQAYEKEANPG